MLKSDLSEKMSFDLIRYSQVWEDSDILTQALAINKDDNILTIGSAGCNVLAMALLKPKRIVAIDMSASQLALIELKILGIQNLSQSDLLCLLDGSEGALDLYQQIRGELSARAKLFWDDHQSIIKAGVLKCGRLEGYFESFRRTCIAKTWDDSAFKIMTQTAQLSEQQSAFKSGRLDFFRDQARQFFGRDGLERHGRDPAQFQYVKKTNIADQFLKQFENKMASQLVSENHYLSFFLTGQLLAGKFGPTYLNPEHFETLKTTSRRIELVHSDVESFLSSAPDHSFSKVGLSDIFEYMSETHSTRLFELLERKCSPTARVAYWTLLVDRVPDPVRNSRLTFLTAISDEMKNRDRLWLYDDFKCFEVTESS